MPESNDAAHAAGASQGAGGTGAAGTPPSVDALIEQLISHPKFTAMLTGAAVGHAKRESERAIQFTKEQLAAIQAAAAPTAGKSAGTDAQSDLAAQLKAAQEQAAKFQQRYITERKQSALSAALQKHGCRPEGVTPALQLLMQRGDIREVTGADGQPQLVGTAALNGVEQDVPVDEAVRAWLTANAFFLPPAGSGGSGAAGGRSTAGTSIGGKSLNQMSAEDVMKLPREERRKLAAAAGLSGSGNGGFWT